MSLVLNNWAQNTFCHWISEIRSGAEDSIKIIKIRTHKKFTIITLKFEQGGFAVE